MATSSIADTQRIEWEAKIFHRHRVMQDEIDQLTNGMQAELNGEVAAFANAFGDAAVNGMATQTRLAISSDSSGVRAEPAARIKPKKRTFSSKVLSACKQVSKGRKEFKATDVRKILRRRMSAEDLAKFNLSTTLNTLAEQGHLEKHGSGRGCEFSYVPD